MHVEESEPLCIVCKSKLNRGARICVECKNPQDWTYHIFRWKELVSAALTAVPLMAGAYSLYQLAARADKPKVSAFVECRISDAQLVLANDGGAIAVLGQPQLTVQRNRRTEPSNIKLVPEDPKAYPTVLAAKQSAAVTVRPEIGSLRGEFPTSASTRPGEICELAFLIETQSFDGASPPVTAKCRCPTAG